MKFPFFGKKEKTIEQVEVNFDEIKAEDIVAPSLIEIKQNYIKLGERMTKSFFVFSYPRYLTTSWLSPLINLDSPLDIALFIHPADSGSVLKRLRKKLTEVQAEISELEEKGIIRDPSLDTAYQDIEQLRDELQTARERVFQLGVYITIYGDDEKQLKNTEVILRSLLESRMVYLKPALLKEKQGFISTCPYGLDQLMVHNPMNTAPLSSVFPFVSPDLSANEGILYGVNQHNSSLVLFDRFSLENANMTLFAKSGSGKSYFTKVEILRYLMQGVDVITLDPENEYQFLSEAVGGSFFKISLNSENHLNPFDLPTPREDEKPQDVLRSNVINLVGLLRLMLGGLTSQEDAIIDQALTETYASKDITPESDPATWLEKIPLMSDLENVLSGMEGATSLLERVRKFTKGSYANFFNTPSNINMDNNFVVFGLRDMEDELRPMAMFVILRYIWNKVRSVLKKRILLIDEAWWIMQSEDGASFLFGICKRARKYWLGVTTITQDVSDFMRSDYGKPIISNSSLQFLMKQSTATIEVVQKTFNLTEGEKNMLLGCDVGEGVFIAGQKRVALKVVASYTEDQIITSAPDEVAKIKEAKRQKQIQ
ncbi:conjugal transfer protein TraC [bacterium (Candidatus Gribaldobacteria) CG_4_10_14_0_2_um_filter_41_16]|uniref:Conjugal transfer protein TraC n=3 Tax=Candidatus Gribaldobacteria TaxID=2798536 RepID=A0A2M7VIV7_9BACT|nr:MAG: conjugal transfer protein TraC [Parcubacteria group bacterium CG1_02_41_26]PIR91046.1 MAG: conjugal transfer protein TraC [bacterium (Candidatus Gribaldobacteria) CG10_big_fil_rev_8_21_14_0_10_41_12]PIV47275.1 MAG: conjugal transfer protein TraC [bacterium (Candidatus Gribaldobacteria) CG02_land_8_20_14_3_00_41_15]PJA01764.1 MAG: conjugal transfer protein TraC [bacterium (Candidatus Gribaldobacteria) CG_4_10_14_0_2_um_filter_41_16]